MHNAIVEILSCWVNNTSYMGERDELQDIFHVAKRSRLSAMVRYILKKSGISVDEEWENYNSRIQRDYLVGLFETTKLLRWFDTQKIPYMPLKGHFIQELYPEPYLRERHDTDILVHPEHSEIIKEHMISEGYSVIDYGSGYHDVYYKAPDVIFEIHQKLLPSGEVGGRYYQNVWDKLNKCENYEYRFSDEDFYIFMVAHSYKHHEEGGVGVRSLLDIYLWLTKKKINFEYVEGECKIIGIDRFEKNIRGLSLKLFKGEELNKEEKELLDLSLDAGAFGNIENKVKHSKNKAGYFFRRVFPPMTYYKEVYNNYNAVLLPYYWGRFVVKNLIKNTESVKRFLQALVKK